MQWLVVGLITLLVALVLAIAFNYVVDGWYIQHNDDRWCSFFTVVTHQIPGDGTAILVGELRTAEREAGCG